MQVVHWNLFDLTLYKGLWVVVYLLNGHLSKDLAPKMGYQYQAYFCFQSNFSLNMASLCSTTRVDSLGCWSTKKKFYEKVLFFTEFTHAEVTGKILNVIYCTLLCTSILLYFTQNCLLLSTPSLFFKCFQLKLNSFLKTNA